MSEETAKTLSLVVTGLQGGSGRPNRVVDYQGPLAPFLEKYGDGGSEVKVLDAKELQELAASNRAKFDAYIANLSTAFSAGKAQSEATKVVDAVCRYLEQEHGFVISDSDPGKDVFYLPRGDIQPQRMTIPNDGEQWFVVAVAPFG